jgi:hypothetical protein
VSRQERDPSPTDVADRDRGRRRPVRRVEVDLLDVVEERGEPGAAEDADLGRGAQDDDPFFGDAAAFSPGGGDDDPDDPRSPEEDGPGDPSDPPGGLDDPSFLDVPASLGLAFFP